MGMLIDRLRPTLLCLALLAASPAMAAPSGKAVDYQVARGPLVQALREWSRQGDTPLLFDARELAGLDSAGVNGTLPPAAALERLLQGLPVRLARSPGGIFTVRRQQAPPRPAPGPTAASAAAAAPAVTAPDVELAPLHVTGSRLPRTSLQATMQVEVIEREDIRRSGYGSLFDLLRHLPGMNGRPPVDAARDGDSPYLPGGAAAATSLDGMGPRATLFLVNGRRLPRYPMVSLQQGALTDLGGLPLSFVERIELVRGGASAIYGADAMAGVVNIVLRDHADGPEAMLQTGTSNQGDGAQYRMQAATGNGGAGDDWFLGIDLQQTDHVAGDRRAWHRERQRYPIGLLTRDGYYLPAYLCPSGMREDSGCWYDSSRPRSLQPASSSAAAYGHWRHDAGNGLHAHAELRASLARQRYELGPTAAALRLADGSLINHVFQEGGSVRPAIRSLELDLAAGIGRDRGDAGWEAGLSRQRSETTLSTEGAVRSARLFDAVANGYIPGFTPLDPALGEQLFPRSRNRGRTDQWLGWWGMRHALGTLAGGTAQLATGIDLRHETWTSRPDRLLEDGELALGLPTDRRRLSSQSNAGYVELGLPLAEPLRLDLAGRLDHDAGELSFSPRAGLRWNPSPAWSLLLSSGRGYRAPSLFERRRPPGYFGAEAIAWSPALPACAHPAGNACLVDVQVVENTGVRAETSRNQSLGAIWSPTPALSLSLTHNRVELRNEILALRPADAGWNADTWLLDERGRLQSLRLYFDNIGRTVSRNWVLHGDYLRTSAAGQWRLSLDAVHQQTLRRRERAGGRWIDLRGHATPGTAANASLHWQGARWGSALHARYAASTRAWPAAGSCPAAQRGNDQCSNPAQLRWNLHLDRRIGARMTAALDVLNLLDTRPVNYLPGNGGLSAGLDDPLGRYFQLTLQFH
jgi:outer membrane receptor protein involved in Fe transport